MGIAAALWDALSKAANLAQISGLLVAVGSSLLRITQSKRECARLERCSRRLHALLQWPTGCGIALLCSEMGGPAVKALVDAAGLVDDYKKSTLWRRVRRGRSMANQLRDMQDVVDSYCGLLLFINAHLLLQQATHHPTLSDTPTSTTTIHEVNVRSQIQSVQAVSSCPRMAATRDTQRTDNDTGEGGIGSQIDNTDPAGCERSVTDQ